MGSGTRRRPARFSLLYHSKPWFGIYCLREFFLQPIWQNQHLAGQNLSYHRRWSVAGCKSWNDILWLDWKKQCKSDSLSYYFQSGIPKFKRIPGVFATMAFIVRSIFYYSGIFQFKSAGLTPSKQAGGRISRRLFEYHF